jgi:Rod binding domain-containing protein
MTNPVAAMTPVLDAVPVSKPKNAAEAAREFEAILIGQMLRSARESAQDDDTDQAAEPMADFADQQFSRLLANHGGVGLAHMVTAGLNQGESNAH